MSLNSDQGFNNTPGGIYNNTNPLNSINSQGYQNQLLQGQQGKIQGQLAGQQFGYNSALQNASIAGQEQMNNANIAAQEQGYASNQKIASINAAAAELPAQLQQQRFSTVMPYLSNALGQASSSSGNLSGTAQTTGEPRISARPVYTNQQIQQQVNQQTASNDQSTATQQKQVNNQMGGRGFGSNSPLAQALGMGLQNQNLATNTQNAASTRLNSAQANATQQLAGQQAQETQYANRQNEAIQRSQVYQNYLSSAAGSPQ